MAMKKCDFCAHTVPEKGQCNKCGFVDGFRRRPTQQEFMLARETNAKHKYEQFQNIDTMLMQAESKLPPEKKE